MCIEGRLRLPTVGRVGRIGLSKCGYDLQLLLCTIMLRCHVRRFHEMIAVTDLKMDYVQDY